MHLSLSWSIWCSVVIYRVIKSFDYTVISTIAISERKLFSCRHSNQLIYLLQIYKYIWTHKTHTLPVFHWRQRFSFLKDPPWLFVWQSSVVVRPTVPSLIHANICACCPTTPPPVCWSRVAYLGRFASETLTAGCLIVTISKDDYAYTNTHTCK